MPHGTSHWLGLDVHDPASYVDDRGEAVRLQEGMTFTVEPGLYLRDNSLRGYQGLGVRIEDNVVVTSAGCEILTDAPKELGEIEELSAQKKVFTLNL
ncbi:Xaa-Pro aminopeptidase [compost metagenome]